MSSARPFTQRVSACFSFCLFALAGAAYCQQVASAPCPSAPANGAAPVCVTTYHNSNARTGLNPNEQVLTPTKLQSGLTSFSDPVTGQIYAQPLFLPAIKMSDGNLHNVVFVATETNDVYAWDGDVAQSTPYWHVNLLTPPKQAARFQVTASKAGPPAQDIPCNNILPNVGITSTPAIAITSGTSSQINGAAIVVVARSKSANSVPAPQYYQTLYALNATTGSVIGWTDINATNSGVTFDPLHQNQRAAVMIQGGQVFITWASHCDNGSEDPLTASWYGWLMSYTFKNGTFQQAGTWLASEYPEAGIWQSGSGPAGDGSSIYVATGNGSTTAAPYNDESPCLGCFGDSVVKLSGTPVGGTFNVLDSFTPFDHPSRLCQDYEAGSGGVMYLATGFSPPNLLVQTGKEGNIYVLNSATGTMGGYGGMMGSFLCPVSAPSGTDNVLQAHYGDLCTPTVNSAECGPLGSPVAWKNNVYFGTRCQQIKQYGLAQTTWLTFTAATTTGGGVNATCPAGSGQVFAPPGPQLSVSQYTGGAVLWALDSSGFCYSKAPTPPVLYAFDTGNLAGNYLFRANAGTGTCGVKFSVPTVVNGHVYVGTGSQLVVFHP